MALSADEQHRRKARQRYAEIIADFEREKKARLAIQLTVDDREACEMLQGL